METRGGALTVVDAKRHSHLRRDALADLDRVDRSRMRLVHDLEGRRSRVEKHAPRAVGLADPHLALLQAERIAVERDCAIPVVDGQDEAELHTDPSCRTRISLRAGGTARPSGATTASHSPAGTVSRASPARCRAR